MILQVAIGTMIGFDSDANFSVTCAGFYVHCDSYIAIVCELKCVCV
jgi:hypothetical protein